MVFAGRDHQGPGDIVDAVSVFGPWLAQQRVLEDPMGVGQPEEVLERCRRNAHALALTGTASQTSSARSRYCWATVGHSRVGASRFALSDIAWPRPGSVRTRRSAAASASGSCRG